MKVTTLSLVLGCVPAVLAAQSGQASANASVHASAQSDVSVPANYSLESRAKIKAAFQAARAKHVPDEPMRKRMAEGEAKGASDAQVAAAVERAEVRLEASQSALVRGGHTSPKPEEVERGEQAMASGASEAQIEALAKHAPADRSLVVALSVLSRLEARGQPVDNALAQIQSKLDARASDDAIVSLASRTDGLLGHGNANATGSAASAAGAHGQGSNAAGASAAAVGNAAAGLGGGAKGGAAVTGAVSGALTGAIGKKP